MRQTALALLLVATVPLAACGSEGEPAGESSTAKAGPGLTVREVDVPRWTAVGAEVSTVDQAQVMARIPGVLTTLSVKEGDYVKKGQVLGRIVDSQLGYQSAALQAQAVQAEADLARTKFLYDNGVYSKARLEQAQAAAAAARAQQRAVGAVAGQGALVAPATGRVLAADIPAGSAVAPGMAIATITSGPVVLRIDLPESLADKLHSGSAVRVTSDSGKTLIGSVGRVYPAVSGGQVRADANVPGLDAKLVGRRVAAEVEAGTKRALLVPEGYVTTQFGVDYVSLRSRDGTVATVPVQTAPSTEAGQVEIMSGVSAGDVLVKPETSEAG